MKILMLNPNHINRHNWGHQLFKNAFNRHHDVTYYGKGFNGYKEGRPVSQIIRDIKAKEKKNVDLIITYETKWSRAVPGLEKVSVPKAHVVIDYVEPRPGFKGFSKWSTVNEHLLKIKPDIIFARTTRDVEDLKRNLKFNKVFFLPFSVELRKYKNLNLNRNIDVMATFAVRRDYPLRGRIQKIIKKMPLVHFTNRVTNGEYIRKINQSKIFANSGSVHKRLTMKFTEVLACNTLLLTEEAEDMKLAGFEDGKHLVTFKTLSQLKSKINYYLRNKKERIQIAKAGMKFVRENHNNDIRVQEFINKVNQEVLR